jgi:acetylornithine deacetylase
VDYLKEINEWILKNEDYILKKLSELIHIKTINLSPSGNEKPGQEYLADMSLKFIPSKNIDLFEIDDVKDVRKNKLFFPTIDGINKIYKNRPNLVVKMSGTGEGKSLVFSGHMDVMPVREKEWNIFKEPFSGKVRDGKMYGRGVADMKSGTIAGFFALKCLHDLNIQLKGDVYAESVIDEENGGVNGTIATRIRYPNIDFAILAEPSGLDIGIASRGGVDMKVSIEEKSSGGISFTSAPPNPIFKLSKIALALQKYDCMRNERLRMVNKSSEYLPLFVYQIASGGLGYLESGSIPIQGHIYYWLETLSYMNPDEVRKEFNDFMKNELFQYNEFRDNYPEFKEVIRFLESHNTDIKSKAMKSIRKAYKDINLKYIEKPLSFACDAFAFKKCSKTDVVVIGPTGGNMHGIDEFVEIESIFNLIKIMVLTAIDYCG